MIRFILSAIRRRRESRRALFEMGVAWGEMSLRERGRFLAHLAASDDLPKGVVITAPPSARAAAGAHEDARAARVHAQRRQLQADRDAAKPPAGDSVEVAQ